MQRLRISRLELRAKKDAKPSSNDDDREPNRPMDAYDPIGCRQPRSGHAGLEAGKRGLLAVRPFIK